MVDILVIGGTSFIGNSMTNYLINKGYTIDLIAKNEESVVCKGYRNILTCDRDDEMNLKNLLLDKSYDYILDIDSEMRQDVMHLLNASSEKNVRRYILCSSNEIYGDFVSSIGV